MDDLGVSARPQSQEPQAIDYQGKGAIGTVTAPARAILERHGYSFPMKAGRLCWNLPGTGCVELDVSAQAAHSSIVLHMQDIDTPEGKSVFLCRTYTMKGSHEHRHSHHLFRAEMMPNPFRDLPPLDPLVAK